MSKIIWLILNTISLAGVIFVNYWVNANPTEGRTIGEISDMFGTLVTPADYAFSIWGLIYFALILFVGYQWYLYSNKKEDQLQEIGIWFIVSNISNALWVYSWISLMTDTSVIIMLLLLLSLIRLVLRLRLEIWDAPVRHIALVWWPIVLYFGWIILATVVNVAAWLVSEGWTGGPLSESAWAIILLGIATLIYLLMIYFRNLREAALVGVWGIAAIAVRHWDTLPLLSWIAITCCIILFLASSYHGYVNRSSSPVNKWKRGEV